MASPLPPPRLNIGLNLSPHSSLLVAQMKDDFQHLEDDMTHLSSRMEAIITSSNYINSALSDRKKEITKLCGVHHLLKKVSSKQSLFSLTPDPCLGSDPSLCAVLPHLVHFLFTSCLFPSFSSCLSCPLASTSALRWDSMLKLSGRRCALSV